MPKKKPGPTSAPALYQKHIAPLMALATKAAVANKIGFVAAFAVPEPDGKSFKIFTHFQPAAGGVIPASFVEFFTKVNDAPPPAPSTPH